MKYELVDWQHNLDTQPAMIYSEIDDDGWEVRKVEVYRDGRVTFSDGTTCTGLTQLSETPLPSLAEIDGVEVLTGEVVAKEVFEAVWRRAWARSGSGDLPGL